MSRPKKNTADYFPHLCNHGKKMSYIERRHGNDGYAVWYKILEKLAQAHDHYLHIEDEIEADFLAEYCLVSMDKLTEILEDLVKVGALDSDAWKNKVVYSLPLIDSLNDLYVRRKDKPAGLMQIIEQVSGVSVYINSHSIVKDSKVENSIRENSTYALSPRVDFISKFESRYPFPEKDRHEIIMVLAKVEEKDFESLLVRCERLQKQQKVDSLRPYGSVKLAITALNNSVQVGPTQF